MFGPDESYTIDAKVAGNIGRYINVRIVPNIIMFTVQLVYFNIFLSAFSTRVIRTFSCKTCSSIRTICVSLGLDSLLVPTFVLALNLRGTTVMKSAVSLGKKSFAIAGPRRAEEGCSKPMYSNISILTNI